MKSPLYAPTPSSLRPREKLWSTGIASLTDQELLQLILGSGCRQVPLETLAQQCLKLLDRHGLGLLPEHLASLDGMGPAKTAQVTGVLELARRFAQVSGCRIRGPEDIFPRIVHYADRPQEVFLSLNLNGAQELLATHTITIGLLNRTLIHPREVFAPALRDRAASLIIAHTHPSGHLEPSREDREATQRLYQAGKLLGIEVLDHLIFSEQSFYSFRQQGELFL